MTYLHTMYTTKLFSVMAHEEISCMACGTQTEGPESPYTGMCKNADDLGNTTKCNEEEFKSCMTGVISKSKIIYFFPIRTHQQICSHLLFPM